MGNEEVSPRIPHTVTGNARQHVCYPTLFSTNPTLNRHDELVEDEEHDCSKCTYSMICILREVVDVDIVVPVLPFYHLSIPNLSPLPPDRCGDRRTAAPAKVLQENPAEKMA